MSANATLTYDQRIDLLERDVAALAMSVAALERQQTPTKQAGSRSSNEADLTAEAMLGQEQLQRIRNITESIFSGSISIDVEADPEWPQDRYVVFSVAAKGDIQELIDMQRKWQHEVLRTPGAEPELIRLSITPT